MGPIVVEPIWIYCETVIVPVFHSKPWHINTEHREKLLPNEELASVPLSVNLYLHTILTKFKRMGFKTGKVAQCLQCDYCALFSVFVAFGFQFQ